MRTFFDTLKSLGNKQQLLLVTGVSKFSLTGLFSGANQLDDVTLDTPRHAYTNLLGYTELEIRRNFDSHMAWLADELNTSKDDVLKEIMRRYNGYSWGNPANGTVANSYAVNKAFESGALRNWWITQGACGWMMKFLRKSLAQNALPFDPDVDYRLSVLDKIELDAEGKHSVDIASLLFQTGYVTITQFVTSADPSIRLNFPNAETRQHILQQMQKFFFDTTSALPIQNPHASALVKALAEGKVKEGLAYIDLWFATFPRLKHLRGASNAQLARSELFYDVIVSCILHVVLAPGAVHAGRQGAGGESDNVVVLDKERKVYVFEFKRVETSAEAQHEQAAKDAIAQIDEKQYASSLLASYSGSEFYCVGVTFDVEKLRIGTVLSRKGVDSNGAVDESEGEFQSVVKNLAARLAPNLDENKHQSKRIRVDSSSSSSSSSATLK